MPNMIKRVKIAWRPNFSGPGDNRWHVDLPTWRMVPGSFLPVVPNVSDANGALAVNPVTGVPIPQPSPALAGATVLVEVPDDYADTPGGPIVPALIRTKHAGQPRWGQESWTPDI